MFIDHLVKDKRTSKTKLLPDIKYVILLKND